MALNLSVADLGPRTPLTDNQVALALAALHHATRDRLCRPEDERTTIALDQMARDLLHVDDVDALLDGHTPAQVNENTPPSQATDEQGLQRVRALHRAYAIYTECHHEHDPDVDDGAVDIPEIGRTCAKLYDICAHCCTDAAGEQREECASEHTHGLDKPICLTAATLEDAAI